jgi:hypothetical protein
LCMANGPTRCRTAQACGPRAQSQHAASAFSKKWQAKLGQRDSARVRRLRRRQPVAPTFLGGQAKIQSICNGKLTPIAMQGLDEAREKPEAQEQ